MTLLEYARRSKRLTQAQVATMSRVSQNLVSDFELRRREPTPAQATRLGHLLGVRPDQLLAAPVVVGAEAPNVLFVPAPPEHTR